MTWDRNACVGRCVYLISHWPLWPRRQQAAVCGLARRVGWAMYSRRGSSRNCSYVHFSTHVLSYLHFITSQSTRQPLLFCRTSMHVSRRLLEVVTSPFVGGLTLIRALLALWLHSRSVQLGRVILRTLRERR